MKKQKLRKRIDILLLSRIHKQGSRFQEKSVRPGYFHNYLLPKNLAVVANEKSRDFVDKFKIKEAAKISNLEEIVKRIENQPLYFACAASKKGSLFESVNFIDIQKYLTEHYTLDVTKNDLKIPKMSTYGKYDLEVTVGSTLKATMHIILAGSVEDAKSYKGEESERQK